MEDFIKQLMAEHGVPADMDPKVRAHMELNLARRAAALVDKRLIEAMPESSLPGFNQLIDNPDTTHEQLQDYVAEHVPDVHAVTSQALAEFRTLYLG